MRGAIGITLPSDSEGTRDLLRAYGAEEGVFVQQVAPGGPADKAGIKEQDIITAINGKPVHDGNELVDKVTATPIGSSLKFYRPAGRQGAERSSVTVADLAQLFPERFGNGKSKEEVAPGEATQARFGITIENLTAEQRQTMNLKESGKPVEGGVVIREVRSGSFAEDIGMSRGHGTDGHQPAAGEIGG